MRVYECCRRFVWCALALLLLVGALLPAAHAVPVDRLPIGSAAVQDRRYQTLTGTGLEGVLTNTALARIQRDAFPPNFMKGDYAAGVSAALDEMEKRLTADPDTLKKLLAEDRKAMQDK